MLSKLFNFFNNYIETLKPSQIFVVPTVSKFFNVSLTITLPNFVVFVKFNTILALVLNGTKLISSSSYINYTIVFIECFTKSSRLKPWLYTSLPPNIESVSIDYDMSKIQMKEQGVREEPSYGLAGGEMLKDK